MEWVARATGGVFLNGNNTAVAYAPFLEQLTTVLQSQYLLTFSTARSKDKAGDLRALKIRIEKQKVKISAPEKALIPGV
jgi:hypothetical protein